MKLPCWGVTVPAPSAGDVGGKLFAIVAEAVQAGIDPELALRATAREFGQTIREQENSEPSG
jgi:XTP/dITP diphosphohydrolase